MLQPSHISVALHGTPPRLSIFFFYWFFIRGQIWVQYLGVSNECCMGDYQLLQSAGWGPALTARSLMTFFSQNFHVNSTFSKNCSQFLLFCDLTFNSKAFLLMYSTFHEKRGIWVLELKKTILYSAEHLQHLTMCSLQFDFPLILSFILCGWIESTSTKTGCGLWPYSILEILCTGASQEFTCINLCNFSLLLLSHLSCISVM